MNYFQACVAGVDALNKAHACRERGVERFMVAVVRLIFSFGIGAYLCVGTILASDDQVAVEIFGPTQGTTYSIKVFGLPSDVGEAKLRQVVEDELASIDSQLSNWNPNSEISRFNASQSTDWFAVSEATFQVVEAGIEASRKSEGAFDITVRPLVDLWGFGTTRPQADLPSDSEIKSSPATCRLATDSGPELAAGNPQGQPRSAR